MIPLVRRLAILPIRAYQRLVAPLLPPCCRFTPTCSHYAVEAIGRNGTLRGSLQAAWRILRCNPLSAGGEDPVPRLGRSAQ